MRHRIQILSILLAGIALIVVASLPDREPSSLRPDLPDQDQIADNSQNHNSSDSSRMLGEATNSSEVPDLHAHAAITHQFAQRMPIRSAPTETLAHEARIARAMTGQTDGGTSDRNRTSEDPTVDGSMDQQRPSEQTRTEQAQTVDSVKADKPRVQLLKQVLPGQALPDMQGIHWRQSRHGAGGIEDPHRPSDPAIN